MIDFLDITFRIIRNQRKTEPRKRIKYTSREKPDSDHDLDLAVTLF